MKLKIRPNKLFLKLENFTRKKRILLLLIVDIIIICFSYWLSNLLKYNIFYFERSDISLIIITAITAIILYIFSGQYQSISRYTGSTAMYRIAFRNLILFIFILSINNIFFISKLDLSLAILFWIITTFIMGLFRFSSRDLLLKMNKINYPEPVRVAIYGAGSAGAQLAAAILIENKYKIINFIDDDPTKYKRVLDGIPIYNFPFFKKHNSNIEKILIAIPSLNPESRKKIITRLSHLNIEALQVPSIEDLTSGKANINNLKPINVSDLLGRSEALPDKFLLNKNIINSTVCITGSGGTIGSELCRQVINLSPKRLIIIDNSEKNLYEIDLQLRNYRNEKIDLVSILGDAKEENLIEKIFSKYKIDIIFHAAAYKHVPLVEKNPIEGLNNNVFTTLNLCKASKKYKIKNFILISSDKAVRPSSVMGASKRLAELIVQAFANDSENSIFSMVRFGNVLDSSGSVVPLFRKQISSGGPITITDKKIIRYFMTVTEAAQLVIQTASMAKGGEVFLLNMGEQVKIYELAKQMIFLSGLTIKDEKNPYGNIEIIETGLRPGEKLYEELLINSKAITTENPMIFKAVEESLDAKLLFDDLENLRLNLDEKNEEGSLKFLKKLIPSWDTKLYDFKD